MSIPGEDLPNSHPAISFVGWYKGHPDYRELPVDLPCKRAVVVGNGNVAMDVARVLAAAPDELALGASQGRPRVKVCSVPEMLEVIRRGA